MTSRGTTFLPTIFFISNLLTKYTPKTSHFDKITRLNNFLTSSYFLMKLFTFDTLLMSIIFFSNIWFFRKLIFSVHEIKLKDNIRVTFWKHL